MKYQLNFAGNKKELHDQLKKWCKEEGQTMNYTILDLIKVHLKKFKK